MVISSVGRACGSDLPHGLVSFEQARQRFSVLSFTWKVIQYCWVSCLFYKKKTEHKTTAERCLCFHLMISLMVGLCDQKWKGSLSNIGTAYFLVGHQPFTLTDVPIVGLVPALVCNLCSEGSVLLWPLFPAVKAP